MIENIYEDIIKNSKIAYLKITCKKNKDDKYIGINVIEQSEEFEKVCKFVTGNNLLSKNATEAMINNYIEEKLSRDKFNKLIEKIIENGHFKIDNFGIKDKDKKLLINIYYLKEYFLIVYNLEDDLGRTFDDVKTYNWSKTLDGEYLEFSQSFYGKSKNLKKINFNKIVGKKDIDLWRKDEVEVFRKSEQEVINSRHLKTYYQVLTKDNYEKIYLETTIWPLFSENNEIIGTKGTSIRVDDKLIFERSMEQNEENFREITKYCDSVFIITDKKRATYVSPSFENVFGQKVELLYKDINKLYRYLNIDLNEEESWISSKNDMSKENTVKVKIENNGEKWIWYKFLPIKNNKGNIEKYVGILTDVTNKRNIEEENNKSKLDFFTNISHELRTPINLISSTIQLVKRNIDNLSQEEKINMNKYITIMESNTLRLIKLVNNLLDSSKLDAGHTSCNYVNADIIYFIEDICSSVVDFAHVNNMNIVFDTNKEEEIVLFDPDIMERVVLNLLSNAVKFNKEFGTIYVCANIENDKIEIRVKDEGKGISKENKELIFKRFEQVHNINKTDKNGSGIGLYLVKSLIDLHGGSIHVESELGKGSEFIVTIPKKNYDSEEQYDLSKCKSTFNKVNIEFSDV